MNRAAALVRDLWGLDGLARGFADAVAALDFEAAEAWLKYAMHLLVVSEDA
ncbi:MAG: hypothetical protein WD096_09965 [Actinomycetota bacterium]